MSLVRTKTSPDRPHSASPKTVMSSPTHLSHGRSYLSDEDLKSWKSYDAEDDDFDDFDDPTENDQDSFALYLSCFAPLTPSLSYAASDIPPSLEVIPTIDKEELLRTSNSGVGGGGLSSGWDGIAVRRNGSFLYGAPTDSKKINTRHVSAGGRRINRKHAQYALAAGMMLGIRESVGGAEGVYEEIHEALCHSGELGDWVGGGGEDGDANQATRLECAQVRKFKFRTPESQGLSMADGRCLPYEYRFKAYAPLVFSKIRTKFGVRKQSFLHSVCGHFNFIEFMSNAKSGQFFFYSHDGRYMIKTLTSEESLFFRQILPSYYRHVLNHPHTFLTHFYGMYRVEIPDLAIRLHFVVMKSVFNTEREIHKIWDLKGSTQGRRAKRGDTVHKDLDFVDEGRKLYLGSRVKTVFMDQLTQDATFLSRLGIMDYSLLLGVHLRTDDNIPSVSSSRLPHGDFEGGKPSPMRSNTPLRRQYYYQTNRDQSWDTSSVTSSDGASSAKKDNDNDDDLSAEGGAYVEVVVDLPTPGRNDDKAVNSCCNDWLLESAASWQSLSSQEEPELHENGGGGPMLQNPITSREDLGIESFVPGDGNGRGTVLREIYFCGIIDILQHYNTRKWGETVMKKAAGGTDSEISCVEPETYATRFLKFISSLLE